MPYRQLDERSILDTLDQIKQRISERFPGSGLSNVATELRHVGNEVMETVDFLKRPMYKVRIPVWIAIAFMIATSAWVLASVLPKVRVGEVDFVQVFEAGANDVALIGISIYFLLSIETRIKRSRALKILHELRSLAHVVDMHQLGKDPELLAAGRVTGDEVMTPAQLGKYLDACNDLLAVSSKLAAMLVQYFSDEVVLATVTEIEGLAAGLSARIWQKITLLERPSLAAR
jgi:hypothetical protein